MTHPTPKPVDWECPHCGKEVDSGDYPDHWRDGSSSFTFECDCGKEYTVFVSFEPIFEAYPKGIP